ncbi:hypothetical protein [Microcella pacifica]|uniref:Uncharacterized protein n=1 Tax=Microcella pacifica TaxID=2591847 RepID=A0A9E5JNQ7_9MICO|nr:hypothetical protein [Microcella pacifica]NHF62246.1 hypothetical protein [Microcella pacifica]
MAHGIPADHHPPDLERVPTLAELARTGLAEMVGKSVFRATPEGEAVLRDTMRRNADRGRAWDARRKGPTA